MQTQTWVSKLTFSYFYFILSCFIFSPDTSVSEIEETFKNFVKRDDIDIILINQNVSSIGV